MKHDTSSLDNQTTYQISKAHKIKKLQHRQEFVTEKKMGLTLGSTFEVINHNPWYTTHHLYVIYPHAKCQKPTLKDKKVAAWIQVFHTHKKKTKQKFDLEVISLNPWNTTHHLYNTSFLRDLPTCHIPKAYIERQKKLQPGQDFKPWVHICGLTGTFIIHFPLPHWFIILSLINR